jgi:hypothetical protein
MAFFAVLPYNFFLFAICARACAVSSGTFEAERKRRQAFKERKKEGMFAVFEQLCFPLFL